MQPYFNQNYLQNLQNMREQIDRQMFNMQQPQQQPTNLTQNFQLAPQSQSELDGKYAKNIDEVKDTLTLKSTLFIDKDLSNLWIKGADGIVRTFTLTEVIELDEKDKKILALEKQLEELKGAIKNESDDEYVNESTSIKKSTSSKSIKSNDV